MTTITRRSALLAGGAAAAALMLPTGRASARTFLNIATAGATSSVYPVGVAMAEIFEETLDDVSVSAVTTGGTVDNMNQIGSGDADIAFANSGVANNAYEGAGAFEGNAVTNLRGLFASATQYVQVVARADAGVASIADLAGKRFVPGGAGSGTERVSREVLAAHGLSYDDGGQVDADFVGYGEAAEMLRNGQTDAALFTGALPLGAVLDVTTSADLVFVPIQGDAASQLEADVPAYYRSELPGGTYRGQDGPVPTISYATIVVARDTLDAAMAEAMLGAVFANQPRLAAAHASMAPLTMESAARGMTVPWHPGAESFFTAQGIAL